MTKSEKNKAACKAWYEQNKDRKYQMQVRRDQEIQAYLDEIRRASGCLRCGEPDPVCLIFHHRPGAKKKFDLSCARNGAFGIEAIKAEIAKCEVICANCHRIHHFEERMAKRLKKLTGGAGGPSKIA